MLRNRWQKMGTKSSPEAPPAALIVTRLSIRQREINFAALHFSFILPSMAMTRKTTRRALPLALLILSFAASIFATAGVAQQAPSAVITDAAPDAQHPAKLVEMTLPSHGARMNAVFYIASGPGAHPTVLLLHGFPGNEQNLDLAQSMRREGWNVLTFHYRGAWGSPGDFSFTHATEDTDAALDFLRDPANTAKYNIDPKRIAIIGHSMGGFMALHAAASHPDLAGVAILTAWNIGGQAANAKTPADEKEMIEFFRTEMPPLTGCTAESLWADAKANAARWDYIDYAPALKNMPVLVLEADDRLDKANHTFAQARRRASEAHITELHLPTDHSFSDHRIALQAAVITWLQDLEK